MPKIIKEKQTNPPTRINDLIHERQLPVDEIIKNINIAQSSLSLLLAGKRKISLSQIIAFADYLECSVDYLLYRTSKKKL